MICSSGEKDMTSEEIDSVGKDFASRYYDVFVGKPDVSSLIRFFDRTSKYSFVQRRNGRPDHEVQGAHLIGEFAERMRYGRCTAVTVRSVNTTRVGTTRFQVSVVGELLCPENDVAREFLQTFVIKRVAWTRAEFLVIDTVFEFKDRIIDDVLPRTSSINKRLFGPLQPPVVGVADVKNKSAKPTTARSRQESRPLCSTGNSSKRRYVRTMDVFNSNAAKNPKPTLQKDESKTVENPTTNSQETGVKVLTGRPTGNSCKGNCDKIVASGSPNEFVVASEEEKKSSTPAVRDMRKTCVRKAKNAARDPMADFVPSYIGGSSGASNKNGKQKAVSKKPTLASGDSCTKSGPRTDENCNGLAITSVVSNKKPLAAKTQAISVKPTTALIDELEKKPSEGEKPVTTFVDKKPKGRRPNERPTRDVGNAKIFVSTNRFRFLTVDDEFDSHSSDLMNPSENMPKDLTGRKNKNLNRNNRLRGSQPTLAGSEEATAAGVPTQKEMCATSVESLPKESGERSKNLVTRDPLSPIRLDTLAPVPDEPIVSTSLAPIAAADEVLELDSAQKEPNERLKNKRRNRKINKNKLRDGVTIAVDHEEAKGPSKSDECPPSVNSQSYIRRVGSIYFRAFISEVVYPLFYSINPLDWC